MRRCAGKKRYEQRSDAVAGRSALVRAKKMRGDSLGVYRCDQCLGWHVGKVGNSFVTRNKTGRRPNKRMRGRV